VPAPAGEATADPPLNLLVRLLGPFSISLGDKRTAHCERPPARRLCQLLLLAPGRRLTREAAIQDLFPDLDPVAASPALSKALSHARSALAVLGPQGRDILQADLSHAWMDLGEAYEVDHEVQVRQLEEALAAPPGELRDELLALALADDGTLVVEEAYAPWATGPRSGFSCRTIRSTRVVSAVQPALLWSSHPATAPASTRWPMGGAANYGLSWLVARPIAITTMRLR